MNRIELEGKWQQTKGKVREAWGALTDDDLDRAQGNWDQLVGTIKERTGQSVEEIESRLNSLFGDEDDAK